MSEFPAVRCPGCGTLYGHPVPACRVCGSETFNEVSIAGEGTVYASTVIRVPGADNQGEEPFEVTLVDLPEGIRVTGRIEGVADLSPGDDVVFEAEREGTFVFEPV
ncbi:Zn-ribbon domain-containing OB-fold protein [Haloplanus sp.]|uniref:Zn-ribbon domain-containing OB-fold protein n=1 Tax=Haloplanus sp. TaxID=1961696 RepID=UPI002629164E|nr:OB-fold domain-containing protein [Haloplanus sp.]